MKFIKKELGNGLSCNYYSENKSVVLTLYHTTGKVFVAKGQVDIDLSRRFDSNELERVLTRLPEPKLGPPTKGLCTDASITRRHGVQVRVTTLSGKKVVSDITWKRRNVSTTAAELYGVLIAAKWINKRSFHSKIIYCDNLAAVKLVRKEWRPSAVAKNAAIIKTLLSRIQLYENIDVRYWNKAQFGKEIPADFGRK